MTPSIIAQPPATGKTTRETDVLIIGGGVTGAGIMRDLALRGLRTLLIDKRDLCAGASGGNHGLLHSGARYVSSDPHSAIECRRENQLLKLPAPQCVEAKQYVNAGGAWAMNIARQAGCTDVNLLYSKGTLLVSHDRMEDIGHHFGGNYGVVHFWTLICLSLGILGENERSYLGPDLLALID
jgi:glycerol-3-phosphate dehydrogenase